MCVRLDELGPEAVGQRLKLVRVVVVCRVVKPDWWCRRCRGEGAPGDAVVRRLAHEPLGWCPTTMEVTVRRYRRTRCRHMWSPVTPKATGPRARVSRAGLRWALEGIVGQP